MNFTYIASIKKYAKTLFAFLMIGFLVFFGILYYFNDIKNWNDYKGFVADYVAQNLGGNVVVSGDLKFSFPFLYIPIIGIGYNDNDKQLMLQDIKIKFDVFSLLLFSPKPSFVMVNSARVPFGLLLQDKGLKKNTEKSRANILFNSLTLTSVPLLGNLHVQNSALRWHSEKGFSKMSLSMLMGKHDYNIDAGLGNDDAYFSLKFDNDNFDFSFKDSIGKITAKGGNIITIILDIIIAGSNDENRGDLLKLLVDNDDHFDLNVDFIKKEDEFKFNNFTLKSNKISFYANNFVKKPKEILLDFVLDKFELDAWGAILPLAMDIMPSLLKYVDNKPDADFLGSIKFKGKDILLTKGGDRLNATLDVNWVNSQLEIKTFFIEMLDLFKLNVGARVETTGLHSGLKGSVKLEGKDLERFSKLFDMNFGSGNSNRGFDIVSDFIMAPDIFIISDFIFNSDRLSIVSNMDYKINVAERKLRGLIETYNLDLNQSNFSHNIDYLINLLKLKLEANVSVKMVDSVLGGRTKVNEIVMYLNISDDTLDFETINVNSRDMDFNARLSIEGSALKPMLTLVLEGERFNLDLLNIDKVLKISRVQGEKMVNIEWQKNQIQWFGLENVDANLLVKIKNVIFEKGEVYNMNFRAKILKNLMTIEKFGFKIAKNTYMDVIAYLGVENSPSVRGSFVVSSLNLESLAKNILDIDDISGYASFSGDFSTKGKSIKDMVRNLEGNMKVVATNVILKNIDFGVIAKGLYQIGNRADLENLTRVKFFQGDTIFYSINGAINIGGGIFATLLNFTSEVTNGVMSSNFSLNNFMINAITKMYFYVPNEFSNLMPNGIDSVDLYMQGFLYNPRVFFENNLIYDSLKKSLPHLAKSA